MQMVKHNTEEMFTQLTNMPVVIKTGDVIFLWELK